MNLGPSLEAIPIDSHVAIDQDAFLGAKIDCNGTNDEAKWDVAKGRGWKDWF